MPTEASPQTRVAKGAPESDDTPLREVAVPREGESDAAIPFLKARNYTPAARQTIDLIVLHTMEAPEKPGTAAAVARWFAGAQAPRASAHYCVDRTSIVQCVHEKDVASHVGDGNRTSIGIEHAGNARQTPADWSDEYSEAMLARSSRLVAGICERYSILSELVDVAGLLAGKRGITIHEDTYADYSHGIRLGRAAMVLDGAAVDVREVLRDPARSALLSDEGRMERWRISSP